MNVQHSDLTPAGYAVSFDLANGWTVSLRQAWGARLTVMAWPTGTNTAIPAHTFDGRGEMLENVEDWEVPTLIAEVAALPYPAG